MLSSVPGRVRSATQWKKKAGLGGGAAAKHTRLTACLNICCQTLCYQEARTAVCALRSTDSSPMQRQAVPQPQRSPPTEPFTLCDAGQEVLKLWHCLGSSLHQTEEKAPSSHWVRTLIPCLSPPQGCYLIQAKCYLPTTRREGFVDLASAVHHCLCCLAASLATSAWVRPGNGTRAHLALAGSWPCFALTSCRSIHHSGASFGF